MMTRILYLSIAVVAALIGWRLWAIHNAYALAELAPFGNSIGLQKAAVTLVEFMDYRCSACRIHNDDIEELARRHPDVRIVIRNLPVFGQPSVREADLVLAAGKQGKFKAMHDILIRRENPVEEGEIKKLAGDAGVDYDRLMKEWRGADIGEHLLQTLAVAERLGINATPAFIVNGKIIGGLDQIPSLAALEKAIADARK